MKALAAALILATVAAPSAARAQRDGWGRYLHPERQQGERYLRYGLAKLVTALSPGRPELGDAPRYVLLEQALLRFERARVSLGDDPELAFYVAQALSHWERPASNGGTEFRTEEAIAAWGRVRAIDPEYRPAVVASQLAILHMRRQEFARARAEYERALERAVPRTVPVQGRFYLPTRAEEGLAQLFGLVDPAYIHGNLAEVSMLAGDVEAAIRSYRLTIELTESVVSRSLAQWGLALALDRAGDREAALQQALRAVREDPIPADHPTYRDLHQAHGAFSVLHLDGVFFEPAYEIHAYEALGHEGMALDGGEGQRRHQRSALRSWRLFLAEGGTSSRFADGARSHVERLERALGPGPQDEGPRRGRGRARQPRLEGGSVPFGSSGRVWSDGID